MKNKITTPATSHSTGVHITRIYHWPRAIAFIGCLLSGIAVGTVMIISYEHFKPLPDPPQCVWADIEILDEWGQRLPAQPTCTVALQCESLFQDSFDDTSYECESFYEEGYDDGAAGTRDRILEEIEVRKARALKMMEEAEAYKIMAQRKALKMMGDRGLRELYFREKVIHLHCVEGYLSCPEERHPISWR